MKSKSVVTDSQISIDPATGMWVAACPHFGVVTQGRTEHEAELALASAVALFLKHCPASKLAEIERSATCP